MLGAIRAQIRLKGLNPGAFIFGIPGRGDCVGASQVELYARLPVGKHNLRKHQQFRNEHKVFDVKKGPRKAANLPTEVMLSIPPIRCLAQMSPVETNTTTKNPLRRTFPIPSPSPNTHRKRKLTTRAFCYKRYGGEFCTHATMNSKRKQQNGTYAFSFSAS